MEDSSTGKGCAVKEVLRPREQLICLPLLGTGYALSPGLIPLMEAVQSISVPESSKPLVVRVSYKKLVLQA